ncbi:hypothetical protein D9M68_702370 [compost metagenome]
MIRIIKLIIRNSPESGIVHVGRKGKGTVSWADSTSHKAGAPGMLCHKFVDGLFGQACAFKAQFVRQLFHLVIGHGDALCAERIGFNNVGSGIQVFGVNGLDDIGTCEVKEVVISFYIAGMIFKAFPSEVFLRKGIPLDHGAHGPIDD